MTIPYTHHRRPYELKVPSAAPSNGRTSAAPSNGRASSGREKQKQGELRCSRVSRRQWSKKRAQLKGWIPLWIYVISLWMGIHRPVWNDVEPNSFDLDIMWVTAPLISTSNLTVDPQLQQRSCDKSIILEIAHVVRRLFSGTMLVAIDSILLLPSMIIRLLRVRSCV